MKLSDTIYQEKLDHVEQFAFNKDVASVFNDMITRSVPGYHLTLKLLSSLCTEYSQSNSNYYDLGCSTGGSTLIFNHSISGENNHIFAIDNSKHMISECRKNIDLLTHKKHPITIECDDILNYSYENSCITTLNFTLQFIPKQYRDTLISNLYQATKPGGVLLLSEKISFTSPHEEELMDRLHSHYKKQNGYSSIEISQKKQALNNILAPESIDTHINRLHKAGYSQVMLCLQCFNFCSILAIK